MTIDILAEETLWTIDGATIRKTIGVRNALRRDAMLPLVDVDKEFERVCQLIRNARYAAVWKRHEAEYDRMFQTICAEWGPPVGSRWMYGMAVSAKAGKQYRRWLWQHHADELTELDIIAPDFLAITRATVDCVDDPQC